MQEFYIDRAGLPKRKNRYKLLIRNRFFELIFFLKYTKKRLKLPKRKSTNNHIQMKICNEQLEFQQLKKRKILL